MRGEADRVSMGSPRPLNRNQHGRVPLVPGPGSMEDHPDTQHEVVFDSRFHARSYFERQDSEEGS